MSAAAADPTAIRLRYTPHHPEPPQHAFLLLDDLDVLEALYGGAAGGGKSDALLMAALRYVHVPGYSALLFRRTYPELTQADGLITRSKDWLAGTDAVYNETEHVWTFPAGARLYFGYLNTRNDRLRYQGGAYQFVGFDELTQFRQEDYRYLLSRIRRPDSVTTDSPLARVPLRMRAASNPGGPGHDWVRRRFVDWEPDPDDPDDPELTLDAFRRRIFIPARLDDNPHLDRDAYRRSLAGLPKLERAQLLAGDWNVDTGDRVYPDAAAAIALGDELDELLDAGELKLPPPQDYNGIALRFGLDFGEAGTHGLSIYPLPHGGIYVTAGLERQAPEVGRFATELLELADHTPAWPRRRQAADLLTLYSSIDYDPGGPGAQSIRTVIKRARLRHPGLKTRKVAFSAYKTETVSYLRWLVENSAAVLEAGDWARFPQARPYLAIGRRAPELRRQIRALRRNPDTLEIVKTDDHGPDALIAGAADMARRHRDRGELERRQAHNAARRRATVPRA